MYQIRFQLSKHLHIFIKSFDYSKFYLEEYYNNNNYFCRKNFYHLTFRKKTHKRHNIYNSKNMIFLKINLLLICNVLSYYVFADIFDIRAIILENK